MNYVTTNIRISEEDYLRLKNEAAKKRQSFAALIREKVAPNKKSQKSADKLIIEMRQLAKKNAKLFKNVDAVKTIREIRYHGKW